MQSKNSPTSTKKLKEDNERSACILWVFTRSILEIFPFMEIREPQLEAPLIFLCYTDPQSIFRVLVHFLVPHSSLKDDYCRRSPSYAALSA